MSLLRSKAQKLETIISRALFKLPYQYLPKTSFTKAQNIYHRSQFHSHEPTGCHSTPAAHCVSPVTSLVASPEFLSTKKVSSLTGQDSPGNTSSTPHGVLGIKDECIVGHERDGVVFEQPLQTSVQISGAGLRASNLPSIVHSF